MNLKDLIVWDEFKRGNLEERWFQLSKKRLGSPKRTFLRKLSKQVRCKISSITQCIQKWIYKEVESSLYSSFDRPKRKSQEGNSNSSFFNFKHSGSSDTFLFIFFIFELVL